MNNSWLINLTSKHSSFNDHIIRQTHLLLEFVNNNRDFSTIIKLSSASHQLLRNIVRFFKHTTEKDSALIDWALSQKSFNSVVRIVTRKIIDFAEWLKNRRKIYEQFRSSSAEEVFKTSTTSQFTRSTTSKASSRNKRSSRKLIRISFKLLKNISKKTSKNSLRKNKNKELFAQIKKITQSSIDSSKNLANSSVDCSTNSAELSSFSIQNFTISFEIISHFEKIRNEISKIILQKLKNRHSKTFTNHKKSSHFIISFSSSEVEMIEQQQQNRFDQNIQEMIQAMIREMMSKIIQQSVTAVVNVIATAARSDSSSFTNHSQMISRTTSKSRSERWITFDIKFFDLMYDNKFTFTEEFIEHVEKDIYFRNVHLFLKRVKNVIRVKNVNQVRENLFICLRKLTLQWYTFELFENIKNLLKYDNEIEYWEKKLFKRFKKSASVVIVRVLHHAGSPRVQA